MHVEIQVALNFLISFLYNKLPRRRVNQFGEELEQALKNKFSGHWYPDQPGKGSAYRCLKTANPLDPVFEIAARNCGLELADVQEYLPPELTIWCEPGEVSYRMSEKSPVKLLYQENEQASKKSSLNASEQLSKVDNNNNSEFNNFNYNNNSIANNGQSNNLNNSEQTDNGSTVTNGNGSPGDLSNHSSTSSSVDSGFNDVELAQRKVRSFNPEAQCFKPIESSSLLNSFNNNQTANQFAANPILANNYSFSIHNSGLNSNPFNQANTFSNNLNASAYFNNGTSNVLKSPNNTANKILPAAGFAKQTQTMTTAQFAQTKFGSTKLKTTNNSSTGALCGINGTTKRNYTNRMSPTEFSNYIKQRALLQQQQQQGINNLSQSLNGRQLQVPMSGANGFGFSGLNNNNLFNGLSPQQSRSISPISNQDNFLLMAAAAVSTNNTTNQTGNSLNTTSLIRNTLSTNNTSPISAANGISCLNSAGNSVCSSLSSNSGSTSLKQMLNGTNSITQNILSPSSNSAPTSENLLGDINYLSELFNNASLSPILGNSASFSSSQSLCSGSINTITNTINSSLNTAVLNKPPSNQPIPINRFNPTPTSFLDLNANNFGNYNNVIGSKPTLTSEQQFNQTQQDMNNPKSGNQQNNQNLPKTANSNANNESQKQFDSSYSVANGVMYPNQYQHLLVAN